MGNLSLFAFLPALWGGADFLAAPSEVLRSRVLRLEPSLLAGETVRVDLFDDTSVEMVRESFVATGPESFLWIGHARGDESSSLVLSAHGSALSGSVRVGSGQYRFRPQGAGFHRIEEVSPSSEPAERQPLPAVSASATEASARLAEASGRRSVSRSVASPDDGAELDLLVVYTGRARRAAGGDEAIASLVTLGVAETNLALERSGVEARLRLVELREVSFQEAGRVESDLEILREENDGALDEVHALRDAFGADVVQLVVEEGDGCGIAYSMGSAGVSFSEWAFSVVERGCIDTTYAMAHELGHNLGCDHAPDDPATRGAFSYSFGYKDLVAGFRTIMAYGPGKRVARFSSPRTLFDGVPTGTELQDNARSLNELRKTAARFRASIPPPRVSTSPGEHPGTLRYGIASVGPAVLEWRFVVGTSPGSSDVLDSGVRSGVQVFDAPAPDSTRELFGRLWYRRGAIWLFEDFSSPLP